MYFNNIPKILYQDRNTDTYKVVTDLLRRVKVRAKVKENAVLLDTYDVKNGETPEIIAHKYYGDSQYHWVVLIVNDITDRYHEWPMSFIQFEDYINDKYSNVDGTHHYKIAQTSGDTSKYIEVYDPSLLTDAGASSDSDAYDSATAVTNMEYEQELQDTRRKIKLLDPRFLDTFVTEYKRLMQESIL